MKASNLSYSSAAASLTYSGAIANCKLDVIASDVTDSIEASVKLMYGTTVVYEWPSLTDTCLSMDMFSY